MLTPPGEYPENYKGEFMSFFYVKNCLEFETGWMITGELKEHYIKAVLKKAEQAIHAKDTSEAARYAGKLVEVFYLDESFYRRVLTFFDGRGGIFIRYFTLSEVCIVAEAGSGGGAGGGNRALMDKILKLRKKIAEHPAKEQQVFMGRQKELYGIYESIQKHKGEGEGFRRISVLISGEAGVGETALMGQLRPCWRKRTTRYSRTAAVPRSLICT